MTLIEAQELIKTYEKWATKNKLSVIDYGTSFNLNALSEAYQIVEGKNHTPKEIIDEL